MSISIQFTSRIPCICPWKVRGLAAQIPHASVPEMSESILPDFIWFILPLLFVPYYIFSAWNKIRVLYMFLIHRIEFKSEILSADFDSLFITDSMHMSLKGSWNCRSNTVCECFWNWFDFLLISIPYYMFSAWNEIRVSGCYLLDSSNRIYFRNTLCRSRFALHHGFHAYVRERFMELPLKYCMRVSLKFLNQFFQPLSDLFFPYYLSLIICFPREMRSGCYLLDSSNRIYFRNTLCRSRFAFHHGFHAYVLERFVELPLKYCMRVSLKCLNQFFQTLSDLFFPYYLSRIIFFPRDVRSGCYICFFDSSNWIYIRNTFCRFRPAFHHGFHAYVLERFTELPFKYCMWVFL